MNERDVREADCILPHLLFLASGNSMSKEIARHLVDRLQVLLILDGWDELPFHKPSFLKELLQSVSPQTRVLITSRPDLSLNLHDQANRVEILGFTKTDIHNYFKNAFKSQMLNSEVKSACDKLSDHFYRYPVVEHCCYVPLNAAILAYIYLNRDQALPATQSELFQELILCCIVRELETRQPNRIVEVSSFANLPIDLKDQLYSLSELAFKGVMQNKTVFTQKELTSLSTLGLLHSVQGVGSIGRKIVTCNFIHLTVQELLAAYYISQLEPAEQLVQFEIILKNILKFPRSVLHFYAGLTQLTNKGIRNLITSVPLVCQSSGSDIFNYYCHLTILNCIFEAQVRDLHFLTDMVFTLGLKLNLSSLGTSMTPMDCLSLHYFLSCIKNIVMTEGFCLNLTGAGIDDQSLCLLLGDSPETSGVLRSLSTLNVTINYFTDAGIAYIARSLSNTTLKLLAVGNIGVTDMGLVPLLETLPRQNALEELKLYWSSVHPDISLKKIGECARRTRLKIIDLLLSCPPMQSEEAAIDWIQSMVVGGNSLIRYLQYSQVFILKIYVTWDKDKTISACPLERLATSPLQQTVKSVNFERTKKNLQTLQLHLGQL